MRADLPTIGDRLRAARVAAGFTSAADFARSIGAEDATYRHHEANRRKISIDQVEIYARALEVSVQWLLSGDEQRAEQSAAEAARIAQALPAPLREAWFRSGQALLEASERDTPPPDDSSASVPLSHSRRPFLGTSGPEPRLAA